MMASLASEGGPMGQRISRELRKFESTGRVSNWLAGQTIKTESKRDISSLETEQFVRNGSVPSFFQHAQPSNGPFNGRQKFVPQIPSDGTAAVTQRLPWDIYVVSQNGNSYTVKVVAGTIGGILPNNWDNTFTVNGSVLNYARVNVNTDGFSIVSASIVIGSSVPSLPQPLPYSVPFSTPFIFGLFRDGQSYRIATTGAIPFSPEPYLVTEKSGTVPAGASPYDIFYQLSQ